MSSAWIFCFLVLAQDPPAPNFNTAAYRAQKVYNAPEVVKGHQMNSSLERIQTLNAFSLQ